MSIKKNISFFTILLFSLVFIAFFYGQVIINPNNFLFSNVGDGLKNYYTFAYHIKHDTSAFNFSGMNYPYGESIFYTDCHPILSSVLKFLASYSGFISDNSIGILNAILILSISITFIVIYFLLVELNINKWIAVLFSVGITLLAPQLFRLGGHLALSYSFAIPLSWLIVLKIINSSFNKKWIIILFANNLFWLFIHAYLGVIMCFFIFLLFIFYQFKNIKDFKFLLSVLICIILPIILFYSTIKLTDTHLGRTENPSGFFGYYAEFDDVFVPHHKPFAPILNKITGNIISLQWEAWSYVGLSTGILFVFLIVYLITRLFKKSENAFFYQIIKSKHLNIAFIAAFIVLLFAMAFPFIQFPNLLNHFPFLKQFRALGRFTWPFYFVATVFSAYVLNQTFVYYKNKKTIVVIFIVGVLNITEGVFYHIEVSKSILNKNDVFSQSNLPLSIKNLLDEINFADYQAILPLPFYHYGSESYSRPRQNEILKNSISVSYQTGIPIIGASLTRLSIQESKNCIQLISPTFYEKEIKKDIQNNKPLLLVVSNESLTKYEKDIVNFGKLIYKTHELAFYSLSIDSLFTNSSSKVYQKYIDNKSFMFKNNEFYTSKDSIYLFYNSFENFKSVISYKGSGALNSLKNNETLLAEFNSHTFKTNKTYMCNFWIYNKTPDALNGYFKLFIDELDEFNNIVNQQSVLIEETEVINGDWCMIETNFKVTNSKNRLKLYVYSNNKEVVKVVIDDFFVIESDVDAFKYNSISNELFYNNHHVKLNKTNIN